MVQRKFVINQHIRCDLNTANDSSREFMQLKKCMNEKAISLAPIETVSVYVHIPYCRSICSYCDFFRTKTTDPEHDFPPLLKRIIEEASYYRQQIPQAKIRSIYIGGGTPSSIPLHQLQQFLPQLLDSLQISQEKITNNSIEWTIEANPEDISTDFLRVIKNAGVNRLSIGVQTSDNDLLHSLNRRSSGQTLISSLEITAKNWNMENISLDFISGIPRQTKKHLDNDISCIRELRPGHISLYSLSLEEGSKMFPLVMDGTIQLPDQDSLWGHMHSNLKRLGYEHYEISNYCQDQRYAKHNNYYWQMHPYIGIGPGAVGTLPILFGNKRIPSRMYSAPFFEDWANTKIEKITSMDLLKDYCITGFRTKSGVHLEAIQSVFGSIGSQLISNAIQKQQENFELYTKNSFRFVRCTEKALMLLDGILQQLFLSFESDEIHTALPDNPVWPPESHYYFH